MDQKTSNVDHKFVFLTMTHYVQAVVQSELVLWWFWAIYYTTTWTINWTTINSNRGVYLNILGDKVLAFIQHHLDK